MVLCYNLAGVKRLLHRQPTNYYLGILGREPSPVGRVAIVDDNAMLDAVCDRPRKVRKIRTSIAHSMVAEGALAIEDGSADEGEPEELSDIRDAADSVLKTVVDSTLTHYFGPFRFAGVNRAITRGPRRGTVVRQWQCTCPFHKDPGDRTTVCTKTISFDDIAESGNKLKVLQAWAVRGRTRRSRATGDKPHKTLRLMKAADVDIDAIKDELNRGLAEETWILPDAGDESSSSSSSTSDSSD